MPETLIKSCDFTASPYSNGDINGQDGWASTAANAFVIGGGKATGQTVGASIFRPSSEAHLQEHIRVNAPIAGVTNEAFDILVRYQANGDKYMLNVVPNIGNSGHAQTQWYAWVGAGPPTAIGAAQTFPGILSSSVVGDVYASAPDGNSVTTLSGTIGGVALTPVTDNTVSLRTAGVVGLRMDSIAASYTSLAYYTADVIPATAFTASIDAATNHVGGISVLIVTPNGTLSANETVVVKDDLNNTVATFNFAQGASAAQTANITWASGQAGARTLTATPSPAVGAAPTVTVAVEALTLTPASQNDLDGQSVSLTATLTGGTGAIGASVSGGGTLSTSSAASGTPFQYLAPSTDSGQATVLVNRPSGASASAVINYSAGEAISTILLSTTTPNPGQTVTAGVSMLNVPNGRTITGYAWTLGGTAVGTNAASISFPAPTPLGPLALQCVATDSTGQTFTATATVTVSNLTAYKIRWPGGQTGLTASVKTDNGQTGTFSTAIPLTEEQDTTGPTGIYAGVVSINRALPTDLRFADGLGGFSPGDIPAQTASGSGSGPTAVQIRQEMDSNSTQLAALVSALALANGMAGVNQALLNPVLTAGVLTAYDLCIYDTAAHTVLNDGVTGLLHKLHVTLGYSGGVQNAQTVTQIS